MLGTPSVHIESYSNYLSYKYSSLKSTSIWSTAKRILSYSRRSLFVARIFRYASAFIAFVETSAVFLVCGAILLLLIPLTLILTLFFSLLDRKSGRDINREIISRAEGKRIVFLMAKDGFSQKRGSYFDNMALDLAKDDDRFIIVVSNSLFSRTSLCLCDNLAVIRETNFFRLMRSIENSNVEKNSIMIVH